MWTDCGPGDCGYGRVPDNALRRQNCQWTLEAPAGATVELYFSMFDLAYGDWFIVRGKDYYWGSIYQPIALPIQLGPDENSISFRFYSNSDRSRGWGFRLVNQINFFLRFYILEPMLIFLSSLLPLIRRQQVRQHLLQQEVLRAQQLQHQ